MAYYALINSDNIVVQVITGVDENIEQIDTNGEKVGGSTESWEQFYSSRPWFTGLICKRTSFNGNIRANFAGVGFKYDPDFNVFIAPQPYPSWKLNYTNYQWESPIAMPDEVEGHIWRWSEINKEWISVNVQN